MNIEIMEKIARLEEENQNIKQSLKLFLKIIDEQMIIINRLEASLYSQCKF